uniref:DEAD/SNF2-like helicase n=1 Tax=Pithovirus LCDPAC02 TaxID=2506601 RepID=A0A481YPB3_9VIRU|nr:MAG: DEAD/SNF2-like helicase [Pithovirus LCDPAC02]
MVYSLNDTLNIVYEVLRENQIPHFNKLMKIILKYGISIDQSVMGYGKTFVAISSILIHVLHGGVTKIYLISNEIVRSAWIRNIIIYINILKKNKNEENKNLTNIIINIITNLNTTLTTKKTFVFSNYIIDFNDKRIALRFIKSSFEMLNHKIMETDTGEEYIKNGFFKNSDDIYSIGDAQLKQIIFEKNDAFVIMDEFHRALGENSAMSRKYSFFTKKLFENGNLVYLMSGAVIDNKLKARSLYNVLGLSSLEKPFIRIFKEMGTKYISTFFEFGEGFVELLNKLKKWYDVDTDYIKKDILGVIYPYSGKDNKTDLIYNIDISIWNSIKYQISSEIFDENPFTKMRNVTFSTLDRNFYTSDIVSELSKRFSSEKEDKSKTRGKSTSLELNIELSLLNYIVYRAKELLNSKYFDHEYNKFQNKITIFLKYVGESKKNISITDNINLILPEIIEALVKLNESLGTEYTYRVIKYNSNRKEAVTAFNDDDNVLVLISSISIASEGISLEPKDKSLDIYTFFGLTYDFNKVIQTFSRSIRSDITHPINIEIPLPNCTAIYSNNKRKNEYLLAHKIYPEMMPTNKIFEDEEIFDLPYYENPNDTVNYQTIYRYANKNRETVYVNAKDIFPENFEIIIRNDKNKMVRNPKYYSTLTKYGNGNLTYIDSLDGINKSKMELEIILRGNDNYNTFKTNQEKRKKEKDEKEKEKKKNI